VGGFGYELLVKLYEGLGLRLGTLWTTDMVDVGVIVEVQSALLMRCNYY